jgi:hypothetical protein
MALNIRVTVLSSSDVNISHSSNSTCRLGHDSNFSQQVGRLLDLAILLTHRLTSEPPTT